MFATSLAWLKKAWNWYRRRERAEHLYKLEVMRYETIRKRFMHFTRKEDVRTMSQILDNKRRLARYLRGANPWRKHGSETSRF